MYFVQLVAGRRHALSRQVGFLGLALLLLCLAWLPSAAQGSTLALKEATLRLSPEYDDPGTLVILSGTFDNIASYPQQITFSVPSSARGIQATEQSASQTLVNRDWTRNGDQLSYALQQQPAFQLEYYMDRAPAGNDREIKYSWRAPYAIKDLTLTVQQPARATNFSVTPKPDSSFASGDGLTSYVVKRSSVAAGDQVDFVINYTKPDQAPSFARNTAADTSTNNSSAPANAASGPAAAPSPAANPQGLPLIPIALIGLGLAALVGAAVYWLMERRRQAEPVVAGPGARTAPARASGSGAPRTEGESRFCRKCGRAFNPGDRFCGQCGTPRS